MGDVQVFDGLEFDTAIQVPDEVIEEFVKKIVQAPIDTRSALANYAPKADKYQQNVLDGNEQRIRVIAPAGSGKTQTVINRALLRIKAGTNADRILILTFDNAAVSSLREKLELQLQDLGVASGAEPTIRTLNAFGYQVLREHFKEEHRPIVPAYRRRKLLQEIKAELKGRSPARYEALPHRVADNFYLEYFSLLKNQLFDPRNLTPQLLADFILKSPRSAPFFEDPSNKAAVRSVIEALIWLYKAYELALQHAKLMDFDDQKLRAYSSLLG